MIKIPGETPTWPKMPIKNKGPLYYSNKKNLIFPIYRSNYIVQVTYTCYKVITCAHSHVPSLISTLHK